MNKATNFLCPLCKLSTPLIHSLYIDEKSNTPFLSLLCECTANSIEISLSQCLLKEKQNCFKHETDDAFVYCRKCSLYMCETCYNYHTLFKANHSDEIEILSEKKEESTNCDTVHTIISSYKPFSLFECGYSKLISEYNDFISSENKIIDNMIKNLNQLKKEIQIKKEIVLLNSKQTFDFIKSLYSSKNKILSTQKFSPVDSIVLHQDHDTISSICENFNTMIQMLLKQQSQIANRPIILVDKDETNRQISELSIDEPIELFSHNSIIDESDLMQKNENSVLTQNESVYMLTEHANAISCMIQLMNNKN